MKDEKLPEWRQRQMLRPQINVLTDNVPRAEASGQRAVNRRELRVALAAGKKKLRQDAQRLADVNERRARRGLQPVPPGAIGNNPSPETAGTSDDSPGAIGRNNTGAD